MSLINYRIVVQFLSTVILLGLAFTGQTEEESSRPSFLGVWMPSHVSLEDPRWRIVDLTCGGMCSLKQFEVLQSLLSDPVNDDTPVDQLFRRSYEFYLENSQALLTPAGRQQVDKYDIEKGAAADCLPDGEGISTQVFAPLPSQFEEYTDRILVRYEYWNSIRTIYIDGRSHAANVAHSRLGFSIGWYEGSTLVVETSKLLPGELYLPVDGGLTAMMLSSNARFTERYSLSEDGQRMDLVWSISDPVYLREAVEGQKSTLLASDWTLNEFVCESFTGEY